VVEPAGVALQAVVGTVSAPIIERDRDALEAVDAAESPAADPVAIAPSFDLPWAGLRGPSIRLASVVGPLLVGTAVGMATGDARLGAGIGLVAWVIGQLGALCRRLPFTFGEGFVGYRPDPVWPQGVQEDDDFRWNWRPRERSDNDMTASQR
jgi:hypothetical protein